ncbi:immunoglobulin-like domain-containing protein [Listeria aquatica]|uniref:immunoglobulin-like domain-containing protein n=1 Tax=Listeria aquatica TaxID=1494960 RepID=UPI003F722453
MNKNLKRFFTLSAILGVTVSTIVPNTAAATANTAEQKMNSNKTTVQKAETSKQSEQQNSNINERLFNTGSISVVGDPDLAANGLKVDEHGNSTGHLVLRYNFAQGASVDLASDYRFSFYLPNEFREIAKTPEFFTAIESAQVYNTSWHVGTPPVNIARDHISYNANKNTFRFDLDNYTATLLNVMPTNEVTVDINLGKAVTESHIRIPRATTGSYHFGGETWKSGLGLFDYHYVQNSAGNTYLKLPQGIDPGYGKDWDYGEDGDNENTKPTITAADLNFEKGQKVADGDLTAGAVAADKEDGIIDSSKIYVKSYNGFTTATPGTHHVTLAVTDSQGAEGTFDRTVVVKDGDGNDGSEEEAGTLNPNPYTIGEGYVKGMYSGDIKRVALEVNGAVKNKVNVVDNANFQYYAKSLVTSQNDQVYVLGYGKDDNHPLAREKVEVLKNESGVATPAKYALGSTNVTGSVSGDVKKVALKVNGHEYPSVKTISATAFQYYAKDKINSLSDGVYIIGYSDSNDKKPLSQKPVEITNSTVQGNITANTMKVGSDAYVTGTHSSNITQVALQVENKVYPKVRVISGSNYQYYAKDKVNSTEQSVKIIGYAGTTKVDEATVNLSEPSLGNGSLSPAKYTIGSSNVKGTYTGSIKYVALKVNGTTYDKVGVVNSTEFQYYAKDKITSTDDTVSVIGYDSHGKIAEQPVQVGDSSTTEQGTITANKYTLGTANITGTHSSEVKYVRLVVDGQKYDSVPVISATDFRYYAKDKVTNKNQSVRIEGLASNNTTVIAHDDIIFN